MFNKVCVDKIWDDDFNLCDSDDDFNISLCDSDDDFNIHLCDSDCTTICIEVIMISMAIFMTMMNTLVTLICLLFLKCL